MFTGVIILMRSVFEKMKWLVCQFLEKQHELILAYAAVIIVKDLDFSVYCMVADVFRSGAERG